MSHCSTTEADNFFVLGMPVLEVILVAYVKILTLEERYLGGVGGMPPQENFEFQVF